MFRNKSVSAHSFAMIPKAEIPRSKLPIKKGLKTTFDAGRLIPVFCEEVLPGDTFNVHMTSFTRMTTPLFPIMDNLHLESFFFFVPNRIIWTNWNKFMGERDNPDDSIDFTVPIVECEAGYDPCTLGDYFGLPTIGQVGDVNPWEHNALPLRAFWRIYNDWFRDQNLQDSQYPFTLTPATAWGDGPDLQDVSPPPRRGKRHDYFTSALPWPQKGDSVLLPLGGMAPVLSDGTSPQWSNVLGTTEYGSTELSGPGSAISVTAGPGSDPLRFSDLGTGLFADLSTATAATINQIRQAFQIQRLLERDARGGTRYTEIVRTQFGVNSPDSRLQRPEYLGGGRSSINITPVAQTAPTSGTALGSLSAFAETVTRHSFSQSFVEHGYIIGMVNVRADLTYQQGLRRHWSRQTRYDYYTPVFAHLGEQAILNKELFIQALAADDDVFGYQERWGELRYLPSEITGRFKSTEADTLDAWHLSQRFADLPMLNDEFIEDTPPVDRVVAGGTELAEGLQFYIDCFFGGFMARPLPVYSVPGLVDHF